MYGDILAAVDLSDADISNKVLDAAEKIATPPKTKLHVLTVAPTYRMPIVGSHFSDDFEKAALEEVQNGLKSFLDQRNDNGLDIKGHVAHGVIYDEIMKAADSLGCKLIVMAAHRPELKDYLLGPNAARVVRHANQSVFVVRQ